MQLNNQLNNIKFRGKSTLTEQWVYGYYYQHEPPLQCITPPNHIPEKSKHYIVQTGFADWHMPRPISYIEVPPDTVCRYTGLNDKNGVEIYEGDIIDIKRPQINPRTKIKIPFRNTCVVKWLEKSACFGYMADGSNVFNDFRYKVSEGFMYEVIGNIHDNKEESQCYIEQLQEQINILKGDSTNE